MKHPIALAIAGGLTSLIAIVLLITLFARGIPAAEAEPVQASTGPAASEAIQIEAWQAEVEATNRQIGNSFQEQEQAWQSRVAQLDHASQAQMAQLEVQLQAIQAQIEQTDSNLGALQAHSVALQQAIQDDNTTYQNEISAITNAENQLRQEAENAYAQLNTAYQALAQLQASAPATQGGSGGHDNADHEEHEDNDDDHEDGDHEDEDHEDHEDEDD